MCHSNPKNLSTIDLYTTCGYSLFTHCIFDTTKNKVHYHRGKDCMKNFCKDLKKHETEIINVEKKGMMQENNHISSKKFVIYVKKNIISDIDNSSEVKFIKYHRVRGRCYYMDNNICCS